MPREWLIQHRAGTLAQWAAAETAGPALLAGERAYISDLNADVVGDGVTKVASLPKVGSGTYVQLTDQTGPVASRAGFGPRAAVRAVAAAAEPVALLTLGDSTGDETSEWVYLLGQALASYAPTRKVDYYLWSDTNQAYGVPTALGVLTNARGITSGGASSYLKTPDTAAVSITGDFEVQARIALADWTPGVSLDLFGKSTASGNQHSWYVGQNSSNFPIFAFSPDGTSGAFRYLTCSTPFPFTDGQAYWVSVQFDADNGAGGCTATFRYSVDGATWTTHQAVTSAGTGSIFDSTAQIQIPGRSGAAPTSTTVTVHEMRILNAVSSGVPVLMMDAGICPLAASGTTFKGLTQETWTLNAAGTLTGLPTVVVLNGSVASQAIAYTTDSTRFAALTPIPLDVCMISFGHNESGITGFRTAYATLISSLTGKYADCAPVAVLQNPKVSPAASITEHAIRLSQIAKYAVTARIPIADVYTAFVNTSDYEALIDSGGVHPINAGKTLWASVVKALFGLT